MNIGKNLSRRTFLQRSSQLTMAGGAAGLLSSLDLINQAAAATSQDYKALVCIYLHGGNDNGNTVIPVDTQNHAAYRAARLSLAIDRAALAGTTLNAANDLGGRQYALHPNMAPLNPVFDAGDLAVLMNVGTLIAPITKSQYTARSVPRPAKLFSHSDQTAFFQSCTSESTSGWGGRMGDLLRTQNENASLTCVTPTGNSLFLSGQSVIPFALGKNGPTTLLAGNRQVYGSGVSYDMMRAIMSTGETGLFAKDHANTSVRAMQLGEQVASLWSATPKATFDALPRSFLATQLKAVANTISISQQLGMKRQVFFVGIGGWDTHSSLIAKHGSQLAVLAGAMQGFYDTMIRLGVSDKVTAFTASDFGRTLSSNGDGSDHGWGGVHLIMGGAVKGQRIYGQMPTIGIDTNDDVGSGRLIPTTSVDQYAATLARWFGVTDQSLPSLLPNLVNYNQSSWNVGFL